MGVKLSGIFHGFILLTWVSGRANRFGNWMSRKDAEELRLCGFIRNGWSARFVVPVCRNSPPGGDCHSIEVEVFLE
jgi:predicted membrane channel-forming protein YqfA (hemolysin III family)